MATNQVAEVKNKGDPFTLTERPLPEPQAGEVRVRVHACGVCHSDSGFKDAHLPGLRFPVVPGHEVAGVIDALGPHVHKRWAVGQRVGVGWYGGHCLHCDNCRRGNFFACAEIKITGAHFPGGYAHFLTVPSTALALIPEGMSFVEAAPLMCAGVTTYNALRNTDARAGDLVAVHGLGGLGHLGVQFAVKMGFRTVAIARGKEKEAFAKQLGAHHYIDATEEDPAVALKKLGGARVILETVVDKKAVESVIGGLGTNGKLMLVGVINHMEFNPIQLLFQRQDIHVWASGTAIDSEDTMNFAQLTGIRTISEVFPLDKVNDAYESMITGKVKLRAVLDLTA
eukprot:TRINITY_DN1575_c0_g1_i1.p2 TRINITY_DN1575_c0_g1~~TRINITY_DN1575_c0_g1_i1.p2  ORF type:complete len:340 (-),score=80.60 TRINITY_DN1575_c0_g1_i1:83-1102(-)